MLAPSALFSTEMLLVLGLGVLLVKEACFVGAARFLCDPEFERPLLRAAGSCSKSRFTYSQHLVGLSF